MNFLHLRWDHQTLWQGTREGEPKKERRGKGSQANAVLLVGPNCSHSNTTVPAPRAFRKIPEIRRQEVSSDARLMMAGTGVQAAMW